MVRCASTDGRSVLTASPAPQFHALPRAGALPRAHTVSCYTGDRQYVVMLHADLGHDMCLPPACASCAHRLQTHLATPLILRQQLSAALTLCCLCAAPTLAY